jgi:glycosyltransferase involved in cell wall biosynthesis
LKILYVTSNGGIHDFRFLHKLVQDYQVLLLHYSARELLDEIRNIKGLEIISKKPLIKSRPFLTVRKHFRQIYNEFKPDIIHTGYVWQVGILAAHMDMHPHLSMPWGSDILFEPENSNSIRKKVREVMIQCDHIQCDAEFVKQKIINDYGLPDSKITVFPWGIDLNLFQPYDKQESRRKLKMDNKFTVIFNRYLEPVYGIKYLLEGFKDFAKDKNDVLLLIISDGSLKKEVRKFINNNSLENKIKLVGRVPNNELPVYLNASDIYISPSLSDGSSLSLLEALACGKGIIVSDVPAIKEWVAEQNGLVINRKDSPAVSLSLNTYFNQRDLIEKHGQKNILLAREKADWDKNYLKLKEIYCKMVDQY